MFKKGFKKQDSSSKVADVAPKKSGNEAPRKEPTMPKPKAATSTGSGSATGKTVEKSTAKAAPKKAKRTVKDSSDAYKVLLRPIITEKAANQASGDVYLFEVAPKSDKVAVRNAIKALYGVTPRRVNILNRRGKVVRLGRRTGKRRNTRNAYVYLEKGTHIDVYEGV